MGVHGLTTYYRTHPRARKKVSLQHLAQSMLNRTDKKAKLLCDYLSVMFQMLSQVDRMLTVLHRKSSFYCDTNFEIYARKITSFVKAFQHLGVDLVFFVDGPHGFDEMQFQAKFSTIKDRYMRSLKAQHDLQQEYCMIKQPINLMPAPTLLRAQWLMTLESAGVEVIYCLGEADQELAHYARSHPEVCGILSTDSDFVVMEGSTLFPYDLLKFIGAPIHGVHSRPDKIDDITCETVSPSTLVRALGIKEGQLPDLAILCGNDFTKPFNRQLVSELKKGLMLEGTDVQSVAKWLRGKEVPLINYRPFNIFCNNHPEYKNAVMFTYDFYSKDYSSLGVVSSKQSYTFFQAILLVVSKSAIWVDDFVPESLTPGPPCVQELLLPLRKIIYFFLGMKSVREFGSTQVESFAEMSILLPKQDENADLRCLHSSNFKDLGANEKLLSFFYLTLNALKFGNHVEEIGKVPTQVANECVSLPESLPSEGIFVCSCLQLIAYLNQHSTPGLNLSQAELDALLLTCLSCCIELKLPHDSASLIPSIRSDTIESWFSRILSHAYLLATVLGLSNRLPQPKDIFSPMVFLLLHDIATQNTKSSKSRELIAMHTIWNKFMSFSSVTALSSAMFTRKAVKSPAFRADLEILYIFANALKEVAHHQNILTCPKPEIVESPSACSSVTINQKLPTPHQRRQSAFQHKHEWVTWFEQPDEEDSEEEFREEEYDLKLCAGNFTCKTCNKHFKEEQQYQDHYRKCYLCNFSACIKVLRKHEFKHTYSSIDVPLFGNSTSSKLVRCESYIAGFQNVNKQVSRNFDHLNSYRASKKWNSIACREDVRFHQQPHCKISSGRSNGIENITGRRQSCDPCSRKGFKSQRSYQAHLKSHMKCDICCFEACPKVLTEHKLTHTEPLEPDTADSNRLSRPPLYESLADPIVSKPSPFQLHEQPPETAYHEDILTADKDTMASADPALADTIIFTSSEVGTVTGVTHKREDSQNDTEGGSTSDLQSHSSSQNAQQPSHKYKPGSEMHMMEYFKDFIQENGGETNITSLRKIAFQFYRKKYNGCPLLSKNLFKSHPQDFIVVEGAGFCRIKLAKHATASENLKELVIPTTESSPSVCRPDTSDDQKNDLAPELESMVTVQPDAIVCSPIFLESQRYLDLTDKEPPVPKAATMQLGDPDLKSGHHSDPMKTNNSNVDSVSITANQTHLPRSEFKCHDFPGHDLPEQDWLLTNPPPSAVCAASGANDAVAVLNSVPKRQPAFAEKPQEKEGFIYTGDDSTPDYQSSSQEVQQPADDHKATPGSDMHLLVYLKDYIRNSNGEASITSLRRIPFRSYQEEYGGPLFLGKDLFKSYPQDFKVVEGAGFCRIQLLRNVQIGEEGGLPPSCTPPDTPCNPVASIPSAGDEDSDMISYAASIGDVCAHDGKGKYQNASTARVSTPATVSKIHESGPFIKGSTGVVTSEMMATEHPYVRKKDSTTVTNVKQIVRTKQVRSPSSGNEVSTKHTQNQQHTTQQSMATVGSSCKSSDLTKNGTCTTVETKGTSDGAKFVSGVKFVVGNEDTQNVVIVDTKWPGRQQLVQSENTILFASVSCQPPKPGSKLHLAEFLRAFLEQNGGEACLSVLRKRAFKRYQQKYLQYTFLSKKFLRSYPDYFDILDGTDSCIVKLHKPLPPATTKPKPDKEREPEIPYSEQDHIARAEDEVQIAADCAGPTHSCLNPLKSMVQETCTVNPDGSMSNTERKTVHLDTSLESQLSISSGSTEHVVNYFKEYLSAHGGGCQVHELMDVFDLKYKQEYALPQTTNINREFFQSHSDVFRVSKGDTVRLRGKPVSQQTEYDMSEIPLSKSGFLRADFTLQPLNPPSGLPNRVLPNVNDSLWPTKSKSAPPKSALPKVEDVTFTQKLLKRGLPKALWPPKSKNSLPMRASPKAIEISKSRNGQLLKVGDEAAKSSSPNTGGVSQRPKTKNDNVSLKVPKCKPGLPKADDSSQPHTRKTKSDLPRITQQQQSKIVRNVQRSVSSEVTPTYSNSDPFTPQHVAEYFNNHLFRYGECSVEELKKTFERRYKKQYIMSSYAVITFVSENFFRRRSDLFEVTTNGTVKLKKSSRS